jgi:hypothetical protein
MVKDFYENQICHLCGLIHPQILLPSGYLKILKNIRGCSHNILMATSTVKQLDSLDCLPTMQSTNSTSLPF